MSDWMGIESYDLAHVANGYASCIANGQLLRLADGTVMSATDIADAVKAGQRIDFRTPDVTGFRECANPVIGVVRTHGKGVRVSFTDGRTVKLTTGHVLPLDAEWTSEVSSGYSRYGAWEFPVRQQWTVRAGQIEPGMELFDGKVESIQTLGKINAVRLWTAHPAWIPTAEGLSIGSRWHEVLHAWAEMREEFPVLLDEDGEEYVDHKAYPEIVPVSASGWLWGTGKTVPWNDSWELHRALDTSGRLPTQTRDGRATDMPTERGDLGAAWVIRSAIAERWTTAFQGPVAHLPRKIQRRLLRGERLPEASSLNLGSKWGDVFADVLSRVETTSTPRLVWSNPDQMTDLLITGSEVVGEPVVTRHLAVAA